MIRSRRLLSTVIFVGSAAVLAGTPDARTRIPSGRLRPPPLFELLDVPVGPPRAPRIARPGVTLAGGPVAALAGGALVIDADSGQLIRTDAAGAPLARLDVAPGAPQLAVDRARDCAYVVDRRGDRIAVVSLHGGGLRPVRSIATPAEPYGVALTPDGRRLLVTAVADRALVAYDTASGKELWRARLAPEPRGVAVSPDGRQVAVAFLGTGTVARGALGDRAPRLVHAPLLQDGGPQPAVRVPPPPAPGALHPDVARTGRATDRPGESYARAAFAVTFVGHGIAIVPHQVSTPHQAEGSEDAGGYGGGRQPPITHRVAFVAGRPGEDRVAAAEIALHQPRAAAYDPARDRLYLVGHGTDAVTALAAASQASVHLLFTRTLPVAAECGATGAAVADDGGLLVFCSLSRRLVVVTPEGPSAATARVAVSGELAPSRLSAEALAGRRLFRKGNDGRLSRGGSMACASCHPEGRTDGLSWRIEGKVLQTPLLAGRIAGTHPFKWDGGDRTLSESLGNTVRRLGGSGLGPGEVRQLAAFLESLPPPRAPSVRDPAAVARGEELFRSREVGCARCHGGDKLTDRRQHPLAGDLPASDTPSLIGLAGSAPYFHDGSAATLEALLTDRGSVHGMGRSSELDDRQIADLIAYLETL
ncbi:MAG TPA: c-type cytochrome [Kofleriaceae bacterium]|nr:c-type cytochrome [Kofleriaceae bacterium]